MKNYSNMEDETKVVDVFYFVKDLHRLNIILKQLGGLVSILTMINFLFIFSFFFKNIIGLWLDLLLSLLAFQVLIVLIVFVSLLLFETNRKRGNIIFEEISDEIQWDVSGRQNSTSNEPSEAPPIGIRVTVRNFARASDLPFVPGKYGAGVYLVANIAIILLSLSLGSLV